MSNGTSAKSNGVTNHPFARNIVGMWPVIKTCAGLLGIALVIYLQSILFTREEGEALKRTAFTKAEAKEMQAGVDDLTDDIILIDQKLHGFSIEQKHMHEVMEANHADTKQDMAEIKQLARELFQSRRVGD